MGTRFWHGARDGGMVGDGMDLHDHFLGTHYLGSDFPYPLARWNDQSHKDGRVRLRYPEEAIRPRRDQQRRIRAEEERSAVILS